jgi:hypothetical protein
MVALSAHLGLCAIGNHFQNRHAALFAAVCLENVLGDVPKSVDVGASRSKRLHNKDRGSRAQLGTIF